MDPSLVVTIVGLCGSGLIALVRVSAQLSSVEARTTTILENTHCILRDHETRLRDLEKCDLHTRP